MRFFCDLSVWVAVAVLALLSSAPLHAQQNQEFLVYEEFGTGNAPALPAGFEIIDGNGDFATWLIIRAGGVRGGPTARYLSSGTEVADDWLVFRPVQLEPTTTYTLGFHVRVTDATLPHDLRVVLTPADDPADEVELLPSFEIDSAEHTPIEHDFQVASSGEYTVRLHCETPPGRLALYIDRVSLAQPEADLALELQLDEAFYGNGDAVYAVGDSMESLTLVRNTGADDVVLNSRMSVDDPNNPDGTLSFFITAPGGEILPFEARPRRALPLEDDFVSTPPQEFVHKFFNLNSGFWALQAPGDYTVQARYRNLHASPNGDAWRGVLFSDPVTFTIE